MKTKPYTIFFIAILLFSRTNLLQAQSVEALSKSIVEGRRFQFKAQAAVPQEGQQVKLTPEYTFTISKDTITAGLPYFGKSFTAPANPANVSIDFSTTEFEYKSIAKKSGWEITITPTNLPDIREIFLDIYDNGNAKLRIISLNRQNISYNGYIQPIERFQ